MLGVIFFFKKSQSWGDDDVINKDLKDTQGIHMKCIHCDYTGEKESYDRPGRDEHKFKYTMLGIPQQNGKVEH